MNNTLKIAVMDEETESHIADNGLDALNEKPWYAKIKVTEYPITKEGMLDLAYDITQYGTYMTLTDEEYERLNQSV